MIKAKLVMDDGKVLLVFGVSAENITRLQGGDPIQIDLTEMGLSGEMLIFYGETTGDLIEKVTPFIGSETLVRDHLEG
jgi:hypothetical protein